MNSGITEILQNHSLLGSIVFLKVIESFREGKFRKGYVPG